MTLTVRTVEVLQPKQKSYTLWDEKLTGFGVRVQPSGLRSYFVHYCTVDPHFLNPPIAVLESDWQESIFFVSRSE